jgi:predicted lipoprotein with Yx(FWY)xxD motif
MVSLPGYDIVSLRRLLMRLSPKRAFLVVIGLVLMMGVSACGSATSTGSTPSAPTTAPTTAPTPTSTTVSAFTIQTAQATVNGKAMTILTDAKGLTLYYFTADTASKTACTGACAQTWPPLLFTGTGSPTASTKLPGELEVYKNANGNQVIYNDHPLYTYSGDSAPGQTNGEGFAGKWFVATPDLAKNTP